MQRDETMESVDHPQVVVVPPVLYAAAFVLGLGLEVVWRSSVGGPALRLGLGVVFVIAGLAVMVAGLRAFQAAGTRVEVNRPTTALVVTGPYRFTRNPIYIGMTTAYVGAALLVDSLWVLALVIPVVLIMHYGVVRREERYLGEKFGAAYRDYTGSVRRWL